jgi:hypothetical protein
MAINVDKLIADAKKKQAEAAKQAAAERTKAEREKADARVIAESKSKIAYADTLKPRLKDIETRLKFYANKIARGDKLDSLEQGEFNRFLEEYNSLTEAVDKAIKESYDVVVNYNRERAAQASGRPTTVAPTTAGPTGAVAQAPAAQQTPTPQKSETPSGKTPPKKKTPAKPGATLTPSGEAIPGTFSPAAARAGEEASMGATPNVPSATQRKFADILKDTEFWYDLPDYIFKLDVDPTTGEPGELGKILVQAVNEGWNEQKFLSKIRLTKWWQSNSQPIRERIISRAKYNELLSSGQDVSKTEFALDSGAIKRNVQARARAIGANLDENAINQIVSRIYDGFLENDTVAIDSFIAPYIGKTSSILGTMGLGVQPKGYTGQALQNYQALQAVAKANGFSINDILPRFSVLPGQSLDDVVLQKLATGELDINRLSQDARMLAAQGQPDYVKGLLQQGYDLEQIYSPYKNVMANILELNTDEIDLNDATLRSAIGQDKEMNLFDFKKALRKDSRWQYTESARDEMSNTALNLLRNFGFMG